MASPKAASQARVDARLAYDRYKAAHKACAELGLSVTRIRALNEESAVRSAVVEAMGRIRTTLEHETRELVRRRQNWEEAISFAPTPYDDEIAEQEEENQRREDERFDVDEPEPCDSPDCFYDLGHSGAHRYKCATQGCEGRPWRASEVSHFHPCQECAGTRQVMIAEDEPRRCPVCTPDYELVEEAESEPDTPLCDGPGVDR